MLPPSLLRGSVAVVAALVLTAVAAPPQPFPSSPCPEVFNYDAINDPGRWTGNLVLESEDELHGVWTRLIFDSPPQEVVAEGFEVVHDVGSKDILIKNRDVVLKAGSARNVKITVIYEGDKFPNLVEYRLNARTVCPRPNTTLNTYFEGDDKAKDFLSLILSKAKPTALKPAFECGTKKGDSYPWQASLSVQRSGNSDYVCEATLISSSHVVAPAHCVTFENEIEKIPNGVLSVALAGGKKYEVKKVNVHQGYDPETLSNDIAVLELTSVLQINDNIRPICLDNQSKIENKAILVGKGLGEDGKIDNKVVGVNVEAIDSTECAARNAELSGTLADNTFCVTHLPEKSTCIGNSGSNIISFKDNVATLKGIVILGPILQNEKHCGPDTSAVVIDVSKYYKWILRSIS